MLAIQDMRVWSVNDVALAIKITTIMEPAYLRAAKRRSTVNLMEPAMMLWVLCNVFATKVTKDLFAIDVPKGITLKMIAVFVIRTALTTAVQTTVFVMSPA